MFPGFSIFGKEISSYWLLSVIGIISVMICSFWRCKKQGRSMVDQLYFLTFCLLGMLVGAKVLAWATNVPYLIENVRVIFQSYDSFMNFLGSGFIYYGGLFGAIGGCILYRYFFNENVIPFMQSSVICIPIFHFWGRLGCFLTGCCYGIESEDFGIAFQNAPWTPNGVPYFPVQLVEAAGNIVILVILLRYERKTRRDLENAGIYFICYGVMRFILEFFRGDEGRGAFWIFSTSQWISVVAVALGLYLVWGKKRNLLNILRPKREWAALK